MLRVLHPILSPQTPQLVNNIPFYNEQRWDSQRSRACPRLWRQAGFCHATLPTPSGAMGTHLLRVCFTLTWAPVLTSPLNLPTCLSSGWGAPLVGAF